MSGKSSPTGQLSLTDAIQIPRHEDKNNTLKLGAFTPQAKSTSKPTQSLIKNIKVDGQPRIDYFSNYSDLPPLPQDGNIQLRHGQKHNPISVEIYQTKNIMAEASCDKIDDKKKVLAVEDDTALTIPDNIHDKSISECSEIVHSDILSGTINRAEPLERAEKEKVVKQTLSNGRSHRPEVISTTASDTSHESLNILTNHEVHPLDSIRTSYSPWRRNLPKLPAEKAWSLEETGRVGTRGGNVEKSVKEALSGVEQSTRSRKASHSLRFFREGLTPEDSRSRDIKSRGLSRETKSSNRILQAHSHENSQSKSSKKIEQLANRYSHSGSTHEAPILSSQKADKNFSRVEDAIIFECFESSGNFEKTPIEVVGPDKKADDIHGYQNKTPSIFTEDCGSGIANEDESSDSSIEKFDQHRFNKNENRNVSRARNSEYDEDSGEEKISSALFLPHQTAQEANGRHGKQFDLNSDSSIRENSSPEEWLEEHILSRNNSETCSLQYEKDNLIDIHSKLKMQINSREEQLFEEGFRSQSQDDDVVPTGQTKLFFPSSEDTSRSHSNLQPVIKKPLETIELIPYSHQVGGHTTLWRFSKRAVCKQLNNRENEFYEKIEQRHPSLLRFLPRYIGVLNVTFERQNRNKNTGKEAQESQVEPFNSKQNNLMQLTYGEMKPMIRNGKQPENGVLDHRRTKSQSCISNHIQPVPTVTFADNRHIIPTSILKPQPVYTQNQHRSLSASSSFSQTVDHGSSDDRKISMNHSRNSSEPNPWGKTFVNKVLREDVFREVFLQKPVAIRHKKSAAHQSSAFSSSNILRNSNSESNLQTAQQGKPCNKSPLRISADISRENLTQKEPMAETKNPALDDSKKNLSSENNSSDRVGRSTDKSDKTCTGSSKFGKRQRRYSSGGLRRRPAEVADGRGCLKYYEEADDTVSDSNSDEPFPIETEPIKRNTFFSKSQKSRGILENSLTKMEENHSLNLSKSIEEFLITGKSLSSDISANSLDVPRPVNPKEARAQPGSRVEYFLLLEDLTAGMKRPCVMDLKMGTRQYGVDCDLKKQESQRKKCAATTSKKLGVRVCGLQVWDVYLQDYIFEDKYYGRNLKNGEDFQKALTRFLYDGVDYYSVLRHIPSILEKLSELEVLIRGLKGYRFYGTSLLMFYDGAIDEGYSSDSTATEKDDHNSSRGIDFKIADFANCVTQEDFKRVRACPPRYPKKPDLGFLRGLRTLKRYFLAIERDALKKKGYAHSQNTRINKEYNSLDENDDDFVSN